MEASKVRILILLILIGILSVVLVRETRLKRAAPPSVPPAPSSSLPSLEPKKSLRLFYVSPDEESLQEEIREIKVGRIVDEEAKLALTELIKGPHSDLLSPLPPGTRVRQLYIDGQGIAYVDFSSELRDNHPGGSKAELLSVYSIVDTLVYNFEQIRRVKILIDGSEVETLAGHIDLRRPLKPRLDFDRTS